MKIGILGDTHKNIKSIDKAMDILKDCELIIHTGDNFCDSKYINREFKKDIIGVVGNCDFDLAEDEIILELNEVKILITHGHRYNVKNGLASIKDKARQNEVQIVFFGHSHKAMIEEEDGIVFVNPGSTCLPRENSSKSVAIMELKKDKTFEVKLIQI